MPYLHHILLGSALAAGFASAALTPAHAEFFGCNTPHVRHYTSPGPSWSYRTGSRFGHVYAAAPRRGTHSVTQAIRYSHRSSW